MKHSGLRLLWPALLATSLTTPLAAGAQDPTLPSPVPQSADVVVLKGRPISEIRVRTVRRADTEALIRRHLGSRAGEPFDPRQLQEDHRRLDALRLFSRIELRPRPSGDGVVLDVEVDETLRLLPFLAVGITDENGASVGPGFKGLNLFGHGASAAGTAQFGGATSVGARVWRPSITPGSWTHDWQGSYRSRRNELFGFDEQATTITAKAALNRTSRVQVGGRVELAWLGTGEWDIALSADGTDWLPAAGLYLTYNSFDSMSNPRSGWFGEIDVARQFGDASSWTVTLDGRRFQPLAERSTMSLSVLGEFQSGSVGEDLPEYRQFAIGGGNSVRGWGLGSRIGRNQAIGTIEYLYSVVPVRPFTLFSLHLYGGIQVAAFSDVGLAWNSRLAAADAVDGYGVGLRLLFPFVDVVRLDVAFGESGAGVQTTFGILLKADKQRDRVR